MKRKRNTLPQAKKNSAEKKNSAQKKKVGNVRRRVGKSSTDQGDCRERDTDEDGEDDEEKFKGIPSLHNKKSAKE